MDRWRKRTGIVGAIVIITAVVAIFLMWPGGGLWETGGGDKRFSLGIDGAESEVQVRRSDRSASLPLATGKPWDGGDGIVFDVVSVGPSPQVALSATWIVQQMQDEEAERTQLISEETKNGIVCYKFHTIRREDYAVFLEGILREESNKAGVNIASLRTVALRQIRYQEIPEGHRQVVEIQVPLDPNQRVEFSSYAMNPDDEGKGDIPVRNPSSGSVPIGAKEWRYSRLVDLGNP